MDLDQPVGSKWLAEQDDVPWGPSTVRAELARLEELGPARAPAHLGGPRAHRPRLPPLRRRAAREGRLPVPRKPFELTAMRREVDEAMRATTEQLSQVTNLLALVTAPPIETATIHRVEVLLLQPQVAMVVVITSTGGVSKRVISYDAPVDPGLVDWAAQLPERGARRLERRARARCSRAWRRRSSAPRERDFLATLAPAFTELEETAGEHALRGGRRPACSPSTASRSSSQIGDADGRARAPAWRCSACCGSRSRSRASTCASAARTSPRPSCARCRLVAANYGLRAAQPRRRVSVIGPVRMDYPTRDRRRAPGRAELSRFVAEVYDE